MGQSFVMVWFKLSNHDYSFFPAFPWTLKQLENEGNNRGKVYDYKKIHFLGPLNNDSLINIAQCLIYFLIIETTQTNYIILYLSDFSI